jgi:hypothetical protein
MTLVREGVGIRTTEFKINVVAPAAGDRIIARARVVRRGRTPTLGQADIVAESKGKEKLVALLTATMMAIEGCDGILDYDRLVGGLSRSKPGPGRGLLWSMEG